MLSRPEDGWSEISIGNWSDRCSYLTDVAVDLLEAVLRAYQTGSVQAVEIEAEGYVYIIVFGSWEIYVITVGESNALTTIDATIDDVAEQLVRDVKKNLADWVTFPIEMGWHPERIDERTRRLSDLCNRVDAFRKGGYHDDQH